MSRSQREAQLKALNQEKWGLNIITELGGAKRDRKAALEREIEGSYARGSPRMSGFEDGTLGERDALLRMLTGVWTEGELESQGAEEYPELASGGYDKPTHAMASQLMAGRIGGPLANAVGFGKETFTGGLSKLGGGDFFGPGGFDWEDIAANYQGLDRAAAKKP